MGNNKPHSASWLLFGYAGRKITPQKSGEGGLEDLIADFDDSQVQYALLRLTKMDDGGDSKRTKFIFITWVGEDAPALKKGMVNMHKDTVGGLFKGFHIEKAIYERGDLDSLSEELDSKLKAAAGANYDLGNIRTGATGAGSLGYKTKSKEFFMQKEEDTVATKEQESRMNDPLIAQKAHSKDEYVLYKQPHGACARGGFRPPRTKIRASRPYFRTGAPRLLRFYQFSL